MTLSEKVFILKSIAPFDKLEDSELILLADIIQVRKYKKDALIYSKENNLNYLYIVIEGEIVDDEGSLVDGYFGINELLNDENIQSSFYAKEESLVFMISKAHLLTILYESPSLMIGFLSKSEDKR